jgi:hypothetical protein
MLDALNFGPREINEMISLLQRYDPVNNALDKVFVVSLVDNGLDDDAVNLVLQMIFTLPYLRKLDLRRNCFSAESIKKISDHLHQIEGTTAVIPCEGHIFKVHSGNQLRLTVDLGEQQSKHHVTREIDFTVDRSLAMEEADPFLQSHSGYTNNPWAKTPGKEGKEASQLLACPDPSSVEVLSKPPSGKKGQANVPMGLGGPGSVGKLTQKKDRDRLPQAKAGPGRQPKRAKAGPPDALDLLPSERVIDKFQVASQSKGYPGAQRRSTSQLRDESIQRRGSLDRARSMPSFRKPPPYGAPLPRR